MALQVLAGDRKVIRGFVTQILTVLSDFGDVGDLLVLYRADPLALGNVAGLRTGLPRILLGPGALLPPSLLAVRMETAMF